MRGLNERIDSSWNDDTSATTQSSAAAFAVSRISALPMLPPTCTVLPAAANSAPTSAVVVVLPFVPVTATIGALHSRYATSTSLNTGMPFACTRRTSGLLSAIPGESTATVTCSSASSSSPGGTKRTPAARSSSNASASFSGGASSVATTEPSRVRSTSTLARPLRPRPMTRAWSVRSKRPLVDSIMRYAKSGRSPERRG